MAETINPEVIRFVRSKEGWIRQYLEDIAIPYESIAREALNEYADSMGQIGISLNPDPFQGMDLPDTETIKTIAGLTLPPAAAVMHYSTRIRTEAVVRLGLYSLAKVFKRMLRKKVQNRKEEGVLALKDGVSRMKKDTERSVIAHFKDYKENIKFQYLFKIVDAIAASFSKILGDRFRACDTDLTQLSDRIGKRQDDRQIISETLHGMTNTIDAIDSRIQLLRKSLF
jgi:hypothetical protein